MFRLKIETDCYLSSNLHVEYEIFPTTDCGRYALTVRMFLNKNNVDTKEIRQALSTTCSK